MNTSSSCLLILGSRSPRRLELLRSVIAEHRIRVVEPRCAAEPGFSDCGDLQTIETRLLQIARLKYSDVSQQIASGERAIPDSADAAVIVADTAIVVSGDDGSQLVLGQPPDDATWQETVRRWYCDYYFGKTHQAVTAMIVARISGRKVERVVWSRVTFHSDAERWLPWYLATGEPQGKAGGYALQGAGSVFISQVEGSLSNVVGLPLRELLEVFDDLGVDYRAGGTMVEPGA